MSPEQVGSGNQHEPGSDRTAPDSTRHDTSETRQRGIGRAVVSRVRALFVALGLVGLWFGVFGGLYLGIALYSGSLLSVVERSPALVDLWDTVLVGLSALLVGGWYLSRHWTGIPVRRLTRTGWYWVVGLLVIDLGLALSLTYAATLAGIGIPDQGLGSLEPRYLYFVYALLSIVVIGPAEELLFRGAIQGRLRGSFGAAASILLTSGLFASLHLFEFTGSTISAVFGAGLIFVGSVLYGYAYERTGNLTVVMVVHGLYNAIGFVLLYFGL